MAKITLSHTKISTFLACRRKYQYIYEENLVPKAQTAFPLQVGDIVHQLIHKFNTKGLTEDDFTNLNLLVEKCYPNNTDEVSRDVALEAARLVQGYINEWSNADQNSLTVVSSEVHMEYETSDYSLYIRVDGLVRTQDERLWRHEIKTAAKTDSAYLSGLRKGRQSAIYHYVLNQVLKEKVHGAVFDLIVKTKVPQYYRTAVPVPRSSIDLALATIDGVVRDIQRGDFYPSCDCYSYNRACDYLVLCEHDNAATREEFFTKIER